MLTVIMFGTFSPFGAILSGITGLVFLFYLGLLNPFTIPFIIVAIAMGIVIGVKMRV